MKARAERRKKRNRDPVSPEQRIVDNLSISGAINKRPKRGDSSFGGDQEVVQIVSPSEVRLLDEERLAGLGSLCVTRIEQIRQKSGKLQGKLSGELRRCTNNLAEILHVYSERLQETGDLASLKMQNANMVAQLRTLRREEEIRTQEAFLRDKEIASLKKEIRELRLKCDDIREKPRVVSDIPLKGNIVVVEDTRKISASERDGLSSGGVTISASESEEIAVISKRISELAARRKFLRGNGNPGQGRAQTLNTGRGAPVQGIYHRVEEFPPLSPGMTPGARGRGMDQEEIRTRESMRVEAPAREAGAQLV